jgi:hypothetical protein
LKNINPDNKGIIMENGERNYFLDAPSINKYEPIVNSLFYMWLIDNKVDKFVDAIKKYLAEYGFEISKHILSEEIIKDHKSIYEVFWWDHLNRKNI